MSFHFIERLEMNQYTYYITYKVKVIARTEEEADELAEATCSEEPIDIQLDDVVPYNYLDDLADMQNDERRIAC